MNDFVHLHVHTEYSLLDGMIKLPDLLAKTKEYGMEAVAVTDHGAMHGAFSFYREATEAGIKPIIGVEAYQADNSLYNKPKIKEKDYSHLVLLAENNTGYQNLMKLTSIAHLEGFHYKPRIDLDLLEKYAEGLIGLSGCLNGQIAKKLISGKREEAEKLLQRLMQIFPKDRFYLELQHHPKLPEQEKVNKELIKLSRTYGVPLVATNDVHYLNQEEAYVQEILLCIQTQHTIIEKNRPLSMIDSPDFYFRSPEEMKKLFIEYPEAIENSVKIAQMCNIKLQEKKLILPPFDVPEGETPETLLRKLCYSNFAQHYPGKHEEIKKRIDYEIEVITSKGYATYFLIVADIVSWAKKQKIGVGPGRGSAAGSIVAYLLGITQIDPIHHEIPFERFLNPSRPSPPDIDLDFADDKRDKVIEYVFNKYGEDKVAQIITFGKMEARQAVRDVGRALGMPYSQPDRIAKMIPHGYQGFAMTIDKALEESKLLKMAYFSEEETRKLLDLAKKLEGVARHASVHAAGVVIADKSMTDYTPLQREARGDKIITQYDMYCLDINSAPEGRGIGLLKMDFLGLRNLTILQNAIKYVRENQGKEVNIATIPLDDQDVYRSISTGETTGIFQLESRGMRQLAKKLQPSKFTDIAAMVALFRPGPMSWIDDFIMAKNNPSKIKYPHKDLKSILEETYGIAVYQEQCMQIANKLAGYTMAEADRLRYAIGKKKKKAMKEEYKKFIEGCLANGYDKKVAENVWSLIEKFVGYGFNKAHSASYGLIAYQTAYMKTKFPIEFMTAVLSAESRASAGPARDQKMALIVEECRRNKIPLLPPDINQSLTDFSIEKKSTIAGQDAIRFGLSAVKNVGSAAITGILKSRESNDDFKSLLDFCQRVDLSKVNRKTIESLIKAGAMDVFGNKASMLSALPDLIKNAQRVKKDLISGQVSLFEADASDQKPDFLTNIPELTKTELITFEKSMLGFYLSDHPINQYESILGEQITHLIGDLSSEITNTPVKIGGIITNLKRITTRQGNKEMAFLRLEDKTGDIEAIIFPNVYERFRQILNPDRIVILVGSLNERDQELNIIVDKIKSIF